MSKKLPALYGIEHSNRNFSDRYYWGKNQFNSSFPIALACYMRDNGITANYLTCEKNGHTRVSQINLDEVFGTSLPNSALKFDFESSFVPFAKYVEDSMEKIDVVISDNSTGKPIRPLEIKLTTLPDDETSSLDEEHYGSEIVVRSPTMRYVALSMASACDSRIKREEIKEIFASDCARIRDWSNKAEMCKARTGIFEALENFVKRYYSLQKPLLLQPIWKTKGKEPILVEQCLDIFVWSDFAITRMFMESVDMDDTTDKITRPQRAALRLARFLYEFSKSEKVFQQPIYDGMTFDTLNDKEFSIPGRKTNRLMSCERLVHPAVSKSSIKEIILNGGQKWLSPERRFDSILFFSKDIFDE